MIFLNHVKEAVGVELNNTAFDLELLSHINVALSVLRQLGIDEFEDLVVDLNTEWPVFTNVTRYALCIGYIDLSVKLDFDPQSSETITNSRTHKLSEMVDRIIFENPITTI